MIVIKEFPKKEFANKEEMFTHLRENKKSLISQKKMITKQADTVSLNVVPKNEKGETIKAELTSLQDINTLKMELVINTTNVMDSHSDVHLKGIWNKSVKEKKDLYLLQEHRMKFDSIITDNVKASVKELKWSELGAGYNGKTEALTFSVEVDKNRNPFMFEQYVKGYVKNHSVGMRYVKIELALNSESKWHIEEKEVWDKYISEIANKEQAEQQGYFWAVTEAKIIEGSAVPIGSNTITPVLNIESKEAVSNTSTEIEPSIDTQKEIEKQIKNFKLN